MRDIFVTRSSMPDYEEYIEAVKPLWESRRLTNMGRFHQELEEKLKDFLKVPYLSLMVNGHMALELAIQSFNFSEGAEVITTPFTFISTTHAIVRNRLRPVFCDVNKEDGTMDASKIENLVTERTVAIVPVHVYGHVCDVDEIQRIADKFNLKVIYDAAHAFGVEYEGKGVGNFGDASIFSFHATKVFNSVEGGAVTFSDSKIYEKLYNLKNFGIRGEELITQVGANAKMNEFCAIMGLCNLKHIHEAIESRRKVAERYIERLRETTGIKIFSENAKGSRNWAYFPILIKDKRDEVYERLKQNRIFSRKYFYPVTSDQACFKNRYRNIEIPVARELASEVLTLPLYEGLSLDDVDRICESILS